MGHEADCPGFADERGRQEGVCRAWCWEHQRCEPLRQGDYVTCPECFHVYRTALELTEAYAAAVSNDPHLADQTVPPADAIGFCQHCLHDF